MKNRFLTLAALFAFACGDDPEAVPSVEVTVISDSGVTLGFLPELSFAFRDETKNYAGPYTHDYISLRDAAGSSTGEQLSSRAISVNIPEGLAPSVVHELLPMGLASPSLPMLRLFNLDNYYGANGSLLVSYAIAGTFSFTERVVDNQRYVEFEARNVTVATACGQKTGFSLIRALVRMGGELGLPALDDVNEISGLATAGEALAGGALFDAGGQLRVCYSADIDWATYPATTSAPGYDAMVLFSACDGCEPGVTQAVLTLELPVQASGETVLTPGVDPYIQSFAKSSGLSNEVWIAASPLTVNVRTAPLAIGDQVIVEVPAHTMTSLDGETMDVEPFASHGVLAADCRPSDSCLYE